MDVAKLGIVDGNGIRRLTIRECQRLCGYPDNYSLTGISESEAFDLLGNTVCVPVIKEIAIRLGQYYLKQVSIKKAQPVPAALEFCGTPTFFRILP